MKLLIFPEYSKVGSVSWNTLLALTVTTFTAYRKSAERKQALFFV
jgi:hypothetical protein